MESDSHAQSVLKIADESIILTKQILKFGSGNIIEDIRKTDSQSLGRSDYAREMCSEVITNSLSELEKTMLRAAAAKIAQGGNCHESAAIVFANLISMTKKLRIQMCRKKMIENHQDYHVFVRIVSNNHAPIIVDEWGSNSKAALSCDDDEDEIIIIYEEVTTGDNELLEESDNLLKATESYIYKQLQIKNHKGSINELFKTHDNLEYLEEDKYIGARMQRAYNDPGLK